MYNRKLPFLRRGRRSISAVKDKRLRHKMLTMRGFCALLLLLATGNIMLPVAVVAMPVEVAGGATFDITWSESCETPPPDAETALEYAASLWGTWISSTVPIEASACWTPNPCGSNVLGCGGPLAYQMDFPDAPFVKTQYPIALANALSGHDLLPGVEDIVLEFNANANWSFDSTMGRAPTAMEIDFVSVALHELAHGLGFIGNMYESYNVGFCLYLCPTPYDRLAVDSEGIPLLSYLPDAPYELAARLTSDAHSGGPNTVAANGETTAKLYTPDYWNVSSFSHLDKATFEIGENRLMTPSSSSARHPGPVTLAIFQDMGWLRADGVPNVVTSGPRIVGVGTATPFTGTLLWDGYSGQPITYTWTATEQMTTTHPDLTTTDIVTLTWDAPGEKSLTLAATDGASKASAVRTMRAFAASVDGPTTGKTGRAYTFTAGVTLDGYPVTYTWEATGQTPVTSDSVTFTWPMSGTQTITVTAVIESAPTQTVHTIDLEETVYHYIYLPLVQRQ